MDFFRYLMPACLFLFPAVVRAQERPALRFESTAVDFGQKADGLRLGHVFRFKNTGSAVLEILRVAPS